MRFCWSPRATARQAPNSRNGLPHRGAPASRRDRFAPVPPRAGATDRIARAPPALPSGVVSLCLRLAVDALDIEPVAVPLVKPQAMCPLVLRPERCRAASRHSDPARPRAPGELVARLTRWSARAAPGASSLATSAAPSRSGARRPPAVAAHDRHARTVGGAGVAQRRANVQDARRQHAASARRLRARTSGASSWCRVGRGTACRTSSHLRTQHRRAPY